MSTTIKICGVRDEAAAIACEAERVDLVGFNFVRTSRRYVEPRFAATLDALAPSCAAVGVFVDPTAAEIEAVISQVELRFVQLHGRESIEQCAEFAKRWPIIKALPVGEDFDPEPVRAYAAVTQAILLDAPRPGSGQTFDWSALSGLECAAPLYVAGGLDPDNVSQAITMLRPNGVDTASGVEVDGAVNPDRIRAFCAAVRSSQ